MRLIESIQKALGTVRARIILVVGGSDTGKTTVVWELARLFSQRSRVAIVDADIGQSHIGPPTTIGWGIMRPETKRWEDIPLEGLYFVGATSPPGHLLPAVVGTKRMVDEARWTCRRVLVDTTGLIDRNAGRALKTHQVDVIRPDVILALQRRTELEHLLIAWQGMRRPRVLRFKPSDAVQFKSREERFVYRTERFRSYFRDAHFQTLSWKQVGVRNADPDQLVATEYFLNRLVALRDREGRDMALGIVQDVDREQKTLSILSPLEAPIHVGAIVFGSIRITPDGVQLG